MDAFEPPKYITSLIAAINDGAKSAQTGALAFAAIGLYMLATAFSATDEDLLLDRTLAISQLSAQIPVTVSFAMMPIVFVALHVFTLIRYDMLAANVSQFREDLMVLVPEMRDRERCRQLLANVEFIQALTAPPGSALRSRLFGFVAWVVIAGFPVIVLLAVQTNALRYQSWTVTNVQRVALLIDLAVLFWFYNRRRRQRAIRSNAFGVTLRRWVMCLWLPVIVVIVNWAWLNIAEHDATSVGQQALRFSDDWSKAAADTFYQPLDRFLCPVFNWGCRFLRVDHRTLVGKVWDSKAIVQLGAKEPLTTEQRASFEVVFLRNRTLRFATLSESRLYAADLSGADLTRANLRDAILSGADLTHTDLTHANLRDATLIHAILFATTLTRAFLTEANLAEADLRDATLSGADLTRADLRDANLSGAELNHTDLSDAILTDANLSAVILRDANLSSTNLSRANLHDAILSGAILTGANLSAANLTRADMTGAMVDQAQLDRACGSNVELPPGLTLKPCPLPK